MFCRSSCCRSRRCRRRKPLSAIVIRITAGATSADKRSREAGTSNASFHSAATVLSPMAAAQPTRITVPAPTCRQSPTRVIPLAHVHRTDQVVRRHMTASSRPVDHGPCRVPSPRPPPGKRARDKTPALQTNASCSKPSPGFRPPPPSRSEPGSNRWRHSQSVPAR